MATCQCTCPAQSKKSICSHVAAVACKYPSFRLRLILVVGAPWKLDQLFAAHPSTHGRSRHVPRGVVRQVAKYLIERYLTDESVLNTTPNDRKSKRIKNHRGQMVSDGGHHHSPSLERELPNSKTNELLLGVVESFVALLNRVSQQQHGCLPRIEVNSQPTSSIYIEPNSDDEWDKQSEQDHNTIALCRKLCHMSRDLLRRHMNLRCNHNSSNPGEIDYRSCLMRWKMLFQVLGDDFKAIDGLLILFIQSVTQSNLRSTEIQTSSLAESNLKQFPVCQEKLTCISHITAKSSTCLENAFIFVFN